MISGRSKVFSHFNEVSVRNVLRSVFRQIQRVESYPLVKVLLGIGFFGSGVLGCHPSDRQWSFGIAVAGSLLFSPGVAIYILACRLYCQSRHQNVDDIESQVEVRNQELVNFLIFISQLLMWPGVALLLISNLIITRKAC